MILPLLQKNANFVGADGVGGEGFAAEDLALLPVGGIRNENKIWRKKWGETKDVRKKEQNVNLKKIMNKMDKQEEGEG